MNTPVRKSLPSYFITRKSMLFLQNYNRLIFLIFFIFAKSTLSIAKRLPGHTLEKKGCLSIVGFQIWYKFTTYLSSNLRTTIDWILL